MAKVTFKFDKERDLKNIWKACNSGEIYGSDFKKSISKPIVDLCKDKEYKEVKDKLKTYLKKMHSSKITSEIVKSANNSWKIIEREYFKRMDKIMNHKFPSIRITGYLTMISMCPYNYNRKTPHFFFNIFSSIPFILRTAGHETMHLYFHYFYWENIEKEIGKEKTGDLKEALTVILNQEFKDLWFVYDSGHPNHENLRKFIQEEWKKKKNFNKLLEKCVNYLKNN